MKRRERITKSAVRLRRALQALARERPESELIVFGHSQGGLVARAALALDESAPLEGPLRLITVSSPCGGIDAASDCGLLGLHLGTLGIWRPRGDRRRARRAAALVGSGSSTLLR